MKYFGRIGAGIVLGVLASAFPAGVADAEPNDLLFKTDGDHVTVIDRSGGDTKINLDSYTGEDDKIVYKVLTSGPSVSVEGDGCEVVRLNGKKHLHGYVYCTLSPNSFDLGDGDDDISIYSDDQVTVHAGAGDDGIRVSRTIFYDGSSTDAYGEGGDDVIVLNNRGYADGGTGKDRIDAKNRLVNMVCADSEDRVSVDLPSRNANAPADWPVDALECAAIGGGPTAE